MNYISTVLFINSIEILNLQENFTGASGEGGTYNTDRDREKSLDFQAVLWLALC